MNRLAGAVREGALKRLVVQYARDYVKMATQRVQKGELYNAEQAFRCSLALDPSLNNARNDLGNLLKQRGDVQQAKECYCEMLRQDPQLALAWNNLGCINLDEGDAQAAVSHLIKAIYFDPRLECVYTNLTCTLDAQGQNVSLTHLGNLLRDERRYEDAAFVFIKAYECFSNAHTHAGLASVYHRQGRLLEASLHYSQAIQLQPQYAECHSNLGHVLRDLGDLSAARLSFMQAVQLNPCSAEDYNHLACICKDLSIITDAIDFYRMSLSLKTDNPNVFCNLIHSLLMVCDWTDYRANIARTVEVVETQLSRGLFPSVHPHHSFLYPFSNKTRMLIAGEHAKAAVTAAAVLRAKPYDFAHLRDEFTGRIRVGYVSSDFKDHPTAHLMQSVPGFHDHEVFEIFCYSLAADDGSSYRKKIEHESDHFVDVSAAKDHLEVANRIHQDKIHVLVNLNGYTKGARTEIFALRPAPIQVMWLGYPGTSGAPFMDYIISDDITTPAEGRDEAFSEKVASMPDTFFCGDHRQAFPLRETAGGWPRSPPPPTQPQLLGAIMQATQDAQIEHGRRRRRRRRRHQQQHQRALDQQQLQQLQQLQLQHQHQLMMQHQHAIQQDQLATSIAAYGSSFFPSTPQTSLVHFQLPPTTMNPFWKASPMANLNVPYVQTNYVIPGTGFQATMLPPTPYVQPEPFLSSQSMIAMSAAMSARVGRPMPPPAVALHPSGEHFLHINQWTGAGAVVVAPGTMNNVANMACMSDQGPNDCSGGDAATSAAKTMSTTAHRELAGQELPHARVSQIQQQTTQMQSSSMLLMQQQQQDTAAFATGVQQHQPLVSPESVKRAGLHSAAACPTAPPKLTISPVSVSRTLKRPRVQPPVLATPHEPAHCPMPAPPGTPVGPQPPVSRAHYGLPEAAVVYCNFNQLYKLDEDLFLCWLRILHRVPNGVLWLLRFPPAGEANLHAMAKRLGIDPGRIIFSNLASKVEHVRRGALADICLDTTLCNGHTTGMDILWSGTPMLTLPRDSLASRVAASQVTALGCPELACGTLEEYEEKAVGYGTAPERLRQIQAKVRAARVTSPLFDTRAVATNLGRCYRVMWGRFMQHKPPAHFRVDKEQHRATGATTPPRRSVRHISSPASNQSQPEMR